MGNKKTVFLRRSHDKYSKLGRRKKKKQKWKKPTGRDNKMREKRRGYPAVVSIGYKKSRIKEKPVIIRNIGDLRKAGDKQKIILGKIGRKKKIEIAKMAEDGKIRILNLNVKRFLRKVERSKKEIPEKKLTPKEAKEIIKEEKKKRESREKADRGEEK